MQKETVNTNSEGALSLCFARESFFCYWIAFLLTGVLGNDGYGIVLRFLVLTLQWRPLVSEGIFGIFPRVFFFLGIWLGIRSFLKSSSDRPRAVTVAFALSLLFSLTGMAGFFFLPIIFHN